MPAARPTTHELVDSLRSELRRYLLSEMPPDSSGELNAMSLADLHMTYLNWRGRFIARRPRTVHVSKELAGHQLGAYQAACDYIINAIKQGDDLTPHLSTRVATAYVPSSDAAAQKMHQQRDRDLLIAEWGIHHLHLSTAVRIDGFVERTGDLLFVYFTRDDAYAINVYPHLQWTNNEMVEICVRNWPEARIFTPLHGVTGLSQQFSESDRKDLRNAGVMQMLEIDGKVYMPRGQTTAGTPLNATLAANRLHWALQDFEQTSDLAAWLDEQAANARSGEWQARAADDALGFYRDGVFVLLGHLV